MLDMGRKLDDNEKIQISSLPEIKDGLTFAATRLARIVKFQERKLRPGPLMNAVFLWYLTQPENDQERIAREFVAKLEALLEYDDAQPIEALAQEPVPLKPILPKSQAKKSG